MSEADLHKFAVQYFAQRLPGNVIAHHSPNEGKAGAMYRSGGVVKGWPDWELIFERNRQATIHFIELKAEKGRISKAQQDCHRMLKNCGAHVHIAYSPEQLMGITDAILGPESVYDSLPCDTEPGE